MCWAVTSFNLWNCTRLFPSGVPALSCLYGNSPSVIRNEIVFLPVTYECSIKKKFSIDFTEPTNKFVAFEIFSVCMNRNFLTYFLLKFGKLGEECLAVLFKFTYSAGIGHWNR